MQRPFTGQTLFSRQTDCREPSRSHEYQFVSTYHVMIVINSLLVHFFSVYIFVDAGLSAKIAKNLHPAKISRCTVFLLSALLIIRRGEERREEKKVLYGRRVERLDESRLVKVIMEKMQDCGSVSWQGEYDQLLRKYGLESEIGSVKEWKERVHERNCRDWMEEVEGKK